jgi:SecD/SecF fusion protein
MQAKGLIQLFFLLLVAVTLLQLFYTFPTRRVEKEAKSYAQEFVAENPGLDAYEAEKQARFQYLDSVGTEDILTIPLLGSFTYEDLKSKQLNLGLDLKGGMSTVLQVDLKDLLIRLSGDNKDPDFLAALEAAEKAQESSQRDFIFLFGQEYEKIEGARPLSRIFRKDASLSDKINIETTNGEVIRLLRDKATETVDLTFKRLKQRIDKLGVTQPNVTLDAQRDLILVEMPGIENPERARNFLQASAALEFWDTYRNTDPGISQAFITADQRLKSGSGEDIEEKPVQYDTIYTPILDEDGNETGEQNMEIVERNADPFADQGPLLRMLTLNDGRGGDLVWSATVMGFADKNKRNAINEMLTRPEIKSLFPADSKFMWSRKPFTTADGEDTRKYMLYLLKMPPNKKPILEGDVITRANHSPNPITGEMAVNLSMNNKGAKLWGEMTTKAANNGNREVAICIDNEVISAPSVRGPITQGNTEITGNFTVQEAADFASLLEVGKLPAQVDIIQEDTVGPSLGASNINSSIRALIIGFGLVLVFMIFYYAGGGIISIIALLLNLFFIFGALASFGTVLTLPGIAGIILTIGMAVDANVIIFERIREELRSGKTILASISDGFKHSYSAIIDANVTTILVAIVLAYFGMGPIKGFAIVLIIGVLTSLFTAVLIGRMIIDWWMKGDNRSMSYWNGMTKNTLANLNIDWIGKRKIAYGISSAIIITGFVFMFTKKFDLGVDFRGGYSYNVTFDEELGIDAQTLRSGLEEYLESEPVVKAVDTKNTFNIVTPYLINDKSDDAAERAIARLHEGIVNITGVNVSLGDFKTTDSRATTHVISSSKVGPTIADDIKKSAFYAGIFALLILFLYIFIRFNRWQYSLGAVAALFHDSMIILGLFSIFWGVLPFSLEINQAFIAALLTVIAYSINDTVVVFDRIREYLGIYTSKSTDEVLNLAINSTFSRTLITSVTTMIMLLPLFIFGGGSIRGFAFAILVGIIVGTYSSIFVATPIVRDLSKELKPGKNDQKSKSFSKAAAKAR